MICPKCKNEIAAGAKFCPNCGCDVEFAKQAHSEEANRTTPIVCGGGEVNWTSGESVPDKRYAATDTIKREDRKKKVKWTKGKKLALAAAILVGIIIISSRVSPNKSSSSSSGQESPSGSSSSSSSQKASSGSSSGGSSNSSEAVLQISNVSVQTNSVATYCTGTIKNNVNVTFKFVQVKGSFKDGSANVIETGDSYAVGGEGLSPGESAENPG